MRGFSLSGVFVTAASVAVAKECKFAIDVVIVQDTTESMKDDLPIMLSYAPKIVSTIQDSNPGSRFGLSSFTDKKVKGYACTRHESGLSDDSGPLMAAYEKLKCHGNRSLPEDQYDAIINALYDNDMGWRPIQSSPQEGDEFVGARLIILHTDALAHKPGDRNDWGWFDKSPKPYPFDPWLFTPAKLCDDYDFPSADQLKYHLQSRQTHLAILTPHDDNIIDEWHQVNEGLLGQPPAFYQYIKSDSSDAVEKIVEAVASVTQFICESSSTTTTAEPATINTTAEPPTITTTAEPPTITTTAEPPTTTDQAPTTAAPKLTTRPTAPSSTDGSTDQKSQTTTSSSTNGDCTIPKDCTTQPSCVPKPDCSHPNCNQPIINIQVKEMIPKHMALKIDN